MGLCPSCLWSENGGVIAMRFTRHLGGTSVLFSTAITVLSLMIGSVAVDGALYFAELKKMQTAADAAAHAGAIAMFEKSAMTPTQHQDNGKAAAIAYAQTNGYHLGTNDVQLGYTDPNGSYNAQSFTTPSASGYSETGGYNAVRVFVRRGSGLANGALTTLFAGVWEFPT